METTRTTLSSIGVGFTIAYVLLGTVPAKAQGDCKELEKVLGDAMNQVHSIPTHVYTTAKVGTQTIATEIIYASGSMYMMFNGKWMPAGSIKDSEQAMERAKKNANANDTCSHPKDELVNGEIAAVYTSHSETPKGKIDMKTWVSKAKGRLLRQDMDSDGGKSVMSSRYEYENVKAPL